VTTSETSAGSRRRGGIRRHGPGWQVRVSAGTDPSTGERIVLHRTVPIPEARTKTARERAEREAHKEAEKVLTRLQAELRELVERLPDEEVPAVLAQARRHVVPVEERPKSPTSFGVGRAVRPGVARRSEVIRVAVVRLDPPRHGAARGRSSGGR